MNSHDQDATSATRDGLPTALIWRMRLLPASETFIRSQGEALRRFSPFYVGRRRVPGLEVPANQSWTINEGSFWGLLKEIRFLYQGPGKRLARTLAARRPALVHAHFGVDSCRAVKIASQLGIPLISTFHGYDATLQDFALQGFRDGRYYLKTRHMLQKSGGHFVAVSEFIRRRLAAQGFPLERTSVQYIGVDLKQFSYSPQNGQKQDVLFVGRLVEQKGCKLLIRAFEQLQAEFPAASLTIIGDGKNRGLLERQAARSLRRYSFLGSQSPEAVREHLRQAAVFCVPSIPGPNGDTEGFGIVFAEAQASGVPVVSFSNGGIPEAVSHGTTGFLAETGDWRGLARYIALLLNDLNLRQKFSRAGRCHVETNFDLEKQTAKLEDLYCHIVRKSRR